MLARPAACLALAAGLLACATDRATSPSIPAVEQRLLLAPDRILDPELEGFLDTLRRSVDPWPERRFRIVILDRRATQADLLAPDLLQIRIGLLLRVRDTDELAFVLAHELAHRDADDFRRRNAPGWDLETAEAAADQAAARRLAAVARDARAGLRLLRRLAREIEDDEVRRLLVQRAAGLSAALGEEPVAHARGPEDARLMQLLERYRDRPPP